MNAAPTRGRRLWLASALLCTLASAAVCTKDAPPPQPPAPTPAAVDERSAVEQAGEVIFDAWFQASPVTASELGDHRFDGAWPRLAPADIEADLQRIDDGLARLAALDPAKLDPGDRVDADMLRNELELQRFTHEVERPWVTNPMWYVAIIGSGLDDLVSRDYAPVGERAKAVASRLEGLPALVDQAIANLESGGTMQPQTELARSRLDGVLMLLDEISARLAEAGPAELERVEAAIAPAREAVELLRAHVEQLLPEATAPWRLGKEAFERKLRLTLHTQLTANEVRRLAILEHAAVRGRMAELAAPLSEVLFSAAERRNIARRANGDPQAALVAAVLEALAAAHVSPPQLRDTVEASLARLDRFVRDQALVTLDEAEVLEVIWTPAHQRGVAIAGLAAPGPLDAATPGLPSFYLVQPVPEDWSASDQESFLREYNDFMLEILSIHEAIPGHFVQGYFAKREPSKIRRVLANGPYVEGWAVYTERVMVEAGYSGAAPDGERPPTISKRLWKVLTDPELRAKAIALHGQKFYLRTITNAILDHSIHAGTMDDLEALELMVFRSFQQEGEAKAKWVRAQVTSTQLSTYFVGAMAWFRLRKQAEDEAKAAGRSFDLRAFHDEALSHGAPPVHLLPELMRPHEATETSDLDSDLDSDPAPDLDQSDEPTANESA